MQSLQSKKSLLSITFLFLLFSVFSLSQIFSGSWVLPQSFSVGALTIHYYGITMALAVGAGWWLALRRASRYGFTSGQADRLFQWLVVWGFVGARLYHVASSWQYYWQHPVDIFKVWHGGLSIFGALIGGFVVVIIFSYKKSILVGSSGHAAPNLSYFRRGTGERALYLLDWLIPSVVLGQIIGRFGNFFNYEAFGYPTNAPWKMFVPVQFRPEQLMQSAFFHPLFLYEALGNVLVLSVLLVLSKRKNVPVGSLFFLYLFLYNTLRFALEFWRVDSTFLWGFVRLNTLSSGVLSLVGIVGLFFLFVYAQKSGNHME